MLILLVVGIAGGAVLVRKLIRRKFPVATVGVLVAANLFLVLELSHPFVGEMATSPDPLRDVITVLSTPAT